MERAARATPGGKASAAADVSAVGRVAELDITALAAAGDAVGRLDGLVVFVPGGAPGDRLRVRLTEVTPRYARAELLDVLQPGPDRVAAPCPVFGLCGGCQWQHIAYPAQLAWKRRLVVDALERVAHLPGVPVGATVPADPPWAYRHKVALPFVLAGGRTVAGFFRHASHDPVEFDSCAVQHPALDRVVAAARVVVRRRGVPGYDERSGRGVLRHVVARVSRSSGEVLVALVTAGELPDPAGLARDLMAEVPEVCGVMQNVNRAPGSAIFGGRTRCLAGRDHVEEDCLGLLFHVSATAFFQVSPVQAEAAYRLALEYLSPRPGDVALDLYCGVGTLTLPLARAAREAHGVEEVAPAVADAERNAALNAITGAVFHLGRVEDVLPRLAASGARPGLAVLDPPRRGAAAAALDSLARLHPRRVAYISCNPATLARDLGVLAQAGYAVRWVRPVDMFPQTAHVEAVAALEAV